VDIIRTATRALLDGRDPRSEVEAWVEAVGLPGSETEHILAVAEGQAKTLRAVSRTALATAWTQIIMRWQGQDQPLERIPQPTQITHVWAEDARAEPARAEVGDNANRLVEQVFGHLGEEVPAILNEHVEDGRNGAWVVETSAGTIRIQQAGELNIVTVEGRPIVLPFPRAVRV